MDIRYVLSFFRSGGHTNLSGTGKIFEYFPPGGILCRTTAVALINHDEVEKVGREFTEKFLAILLTSNRLIEGEVNLIGWIQSPDDWEGGVGLSVTSCHNQKNAVLSPGDCFDSPVDSDTLVVTRFLAAS